MVRSVGHVLSRAGFGGRPAAVGAVVALAVLALLIAQPPFPRHGPTLLLVGVAWLAFGVGAVLVRRAPPRAAVVLIVLGGFGLPLAAAFDPPRSSDDLYRYIWDGRVQAEGINPYRYVPAAADLEYLRDESLWRPGTTWCVSADTTDAYRGDALAPGCTLINRPSVPTIYPPVAQAMFRVVAAWSPPSSGHVPMQVAAALMAGVATVVLLVGLRWLGQDARWSVLWAWCPAVAYEAGSNAHIDVLAALLTASAVVVLCRARTRPAWAGGGVLLGLAIATKLTPVLVLPAVVRRRPLAILTGLSGTIAAVYLPHILAVGSGVIGFVPGYLAEEGFVDGSRFALVSWLLPDPWRTVAVAVVLGAVAVRAVVLTPGGAGPAPTYDRPWAGAATVVGTALLLAAPSYPWYALLLVVLVAFGARPEWLAVVAAGYLAQYANDLGLTIVTAQRIGYGTALAIVVAGGLVRRELRRRELRRAAVPPSLPARGVEPRLR